MNIHPITSLPKATPIHQVLLISLVERKEPAKERARHKKHQVKDGHSHSHQVIRTVGQVVCRCCPHNSYQDIDDKKYPCVCSHSNYSETSYKTFSPNFITSMKLKVHENHNINTN